MSQYNFYVCKTMEEYHAKRKEYEEIVAEAHQAYNGGKGAHIALHIDFPLPPSGEEFYVGIM